MPSIFADNNFQDINVNNPCLCFECVSTLYSFHNFKKQCLQTEENLRLFVREHPKVKKVDIVAVQIYHEGTTLPIINKGMWNIEIFV